MGFKQSLFRRLGKAIYDYNMISNNDKILIALSGGKDSFTLLHSLDIMRKKAPINFELFCCIVHSGFLGFDTTRIEEWLKDNNYNYRIEHSNIYESVFLNPVKAKDGCFHCARQRKSVLYRVAEETNCNKIALGHHREDFIESFFMSVMYNGIIETMLPIFDTKKHKFKVIRPLVYVSEATTTSYAIQNKFPVTHCYCPLHDNDKMRRKKIKKFLLDFEKNDIKGLKDNIFHSLTNISIKKILDLKLNKDLANLIKREKL